MEVVAPPAVRAAAGLASRSPRLLRALPDERLVRLARAGQLAAFETIYDRHHAAILSFCRHMLGNREDAEDAVQHTFAAAHRRLTDDDRALELVPWLYSVARNRCLSMLRGRREYATDGDTLDRPSTEGLAEAVQRRADLQSLLGDLAALPDDQRAALLLAELQDMPHTAIADVLGCPPPKVRSLVFQARKSLVQDLEARDISCLEIREELTTASGPGRRRWQVHRHLRSCPECAAFSDDLRRQRKLMAL